MSRSTFILFYCIVAVMELVVIQFDLGFRWLTKPLIVITLLICYLTQRKPDWQTVDTLFASSLLFALGGDILLLWDDFFIWGLGSFLLMQLLYVIVFLKGCNYYGLREGIIGMALLGFLFASLSFLWFGLEDMKIPVTIYSAAICLMSWVAWTRDLRYEGYYLVGIGTVFFIISDTCIALQAFGGLALGKLTVMSTYIVAQLLIVLGFLAYLQSPQNQQVPHHT